MRKLFAFITLAFALLVVVLVGAPTINDSMKNGTDFNGGYNIVYHVTNEDGNEYKNDSMRMSVMDKAANNANSRLNTLNITNPDVAIANENYISITIQDLPESQLDTVRYAIANSAEVTVRDTANRLLCKGSDVFESLSLTSGGDQGVYLTVKVKDGDALKAATESVAASYTQDESGNAEPNLIIWIGFQETYTEDLADELGFNGDSWSEYQTNAYARFKILTALAINEPLSDDFSCSANVLDSNVQLMNKILNQEKVLYVLTEESCSKIGSYYDSNVPSLAIIAGVIGLVIICALLIYVYRISGIASALSIVVYGVLSLLFYNSFGGLFGLETLIAMMTGIILSVDANVVFLERIRDELRKGKEVSRAFDEGSKKSVSTVLDANILVLVAAFALYLFGTQVIKSFSAFLIISQIVIILVVVFLTRYMLSLLCHARVNKSYKWFGLKEEEIGDINDIEAKEVNAPKLFKKINFTKLSKLKYIISGGIVALGVVVALVFTLINGSTFNYSKNLRQGTRFSFTTLDTQFSTEEKVKEWFMDEENAGKKPAKIIIEEDNVTLSKTDITYLDGESLFENYNINLDEVTGRTFTSYTVSVYYNKELSNEVVSSIDEYFEAQQDIFENEDEEIDIFDMNYFSGNFEPYSGAKAVGNGLFVLGMACLFMLVYLSIRFSFSYAITAVTSIAEAELLLFSLLAILRIQAGVELVSLGLCLLVLVSNELSISFDRLRENISETKDTVWTKETRLLVAEKSLHQSTYGLVFGTLAAIALGLLVLFFTITNVSLGLLFVLAGVVSLFVSMFLMPATWATIDTFVANIKAKIKSKKAIKNKNKVDLDKDDTKEYVFFGIND